MKNTESTRRTGTLGVHDAKITIMEEGVNEKDLKEKVMLRLVRYLKDQGWHFHVPYDDYAWLEKDRSYTKNRHRFAEWRRKGIKDGLEVEVGVSGRCLEIEFWENVNDHTADNQKGGKYIFDKESKMPYRLRCRIRATKLKIIAWFKKYHDYELTENSTPVIPANVTAIERVKRSYRESWHKKSDDLDAKENHADQPYNSLSAEKVMIEQGSLVWAADYQGRWLQGRAFHNINNMWWIVTGRHGLVNTGASNIYTALPEDIRERMPESLRIKKIKAHISSAVSKKDYLKAHKLDIELNKLICPQLSSETKEAA